MIIKMIDMALDATFLTINGLSRFRNYLAVRNPTRREPVDKAEDARLVSEWIKACEERDAIQSELTEPTSSRLFETQATLLRTSKEAGAKCHHLLIELRAHRKGEP
jgi:hypothetical protein